MGKMVARFLIIAGLAVSSAALTDCFASDDPAPSAASGPGAAEPAKSKPVSGLRVGEPQYLSDKAFFISPVTPLTIMVVGGTSGIAKTEYRLDGGEWKAYAPFALGTDGSHLIEYRSIDNAGTEESPRSFSVNVDGTAPQTTASIDGRQVAQGRPALVGKNSTITLEAVDAGAGVASVEYRVDQGPWQPYAPFIAPAKGVHTFSYRSTDRLGNREEEKTVTITSERIPVRTSLVVGEPKYRDKDLLVVSERTPLTLAVESMSGGAATEFNVDGGAWQKYAPFTLHGEGKHQVSYHSNDDRGQKEAIQTVTILVDGTPPETWLMSADRKLERGESLAAKGKLEFTLAAEDKMSSVKSTEYRINEGAWLPAVPMSFDKEGSYRIEFRSTDVVGNVEPAGSFTAIIDRTPPTSEMAVGQPQREADGLIHVATSTVLTPKGADNLSGIDRVEYTIDGREETRDSLPFTITTPGRYRIDYQSVDKAGNKESLKTILVVVDEGTAKGGIKDAGMDGEMPGSVRQFKFDRKSAATLDGLPAGMPLADPTGPARAASIGTAPPESAYADDYAAPAMNRPSPQPVMNIPKKSNIGFWEYFTLGVVNVGLILGVMLL